METALSYPHTDYIRIMKKRKDGKCEFKGKIPVCK